MPRRRHTPEQTIRKLAEGHRLLAGGQTVEEVCRQFGIAESTWARSAAPVRRHEGQRRGTPPRARVRERPLEEPVGGGRVGQRDVEASRRGKMVTPSSASSCGTSPAGDRGGGGVVPPKNSGVQAGG